MHLQDEYFPSSDSEDPNFGNDDNFDTANDDNFDTASEQDMEGSEQVKHMCKVISHVTVYSEYTY